MKIDHPGWAIKYPNNPEGEWWQPGCHGSGCWYDETPYLSEFFNTAEEAKKTAESLKIEDNMTAPYIIIEAWEPLCYNLQTANDTLRQANNITMRDIWDIEEMLDDVKGILSKNKKGKV